MTTEAQEVGLGYIRTIPGILKVAQEVVNFVGMICVAASHPFGKGDAFLACSVIALIVTGVLLICYVTQIVVKLQIPWYRIEFFYCVIWAIFYLVVSALVVSVNLGGHIAGGIFGFAATLLYGVDAYHKFMAVAAS